MQLITYQIAQLGHINCSIHYYSIRTISHPVVGIDFTASSDQSGLF